MDEERDLQQRKRFRLPRYDYSNKGVYFITICTQNRKNILSSVIVGEGFPLPHSAMVRLSYYGEIVEHWIRAIPEKYSQISVDRYVIMPNHIHLLLSISNGDGRGDPSPTIHSVIGWLKFQSTKEINLLRATVGEPVFQRSFHDHIIRNRDDYDEIVKYIHENPMRWKFDQLYAEE